MQNVGSNGSEDSTKETKSTDEGQTTLTSSSPAMEKDQLLAIHQNLTESSHSEDEVSEVINLFHCRCSSLCGV